MPIYLEDLTPRRVFELGSIDVTEDEIVDFASRHDLQVFHTDPNGRPPRSSAG